MAAESHSVMRRLKIFAIMAVMAVILAACGGNKAEETTAAPETTAEAAAAVTEEETETAEEETETADGTVYTMLQGVVQDVSDDGDSFSLLCDDGVTRHINTSDICDVEVDIEDGVQIAIACIGEITDDLSGVTLVVALPEQEEWTIQTRTGVTTSNAMSAFVMESEGESIPFLKDNCPIEDDALAHNDGDRITVTYVYAMDTYFPIEIKPAAD